jgi:hypothetical protein
MRPAELALDVAWLSVIKALRAAETTAKVPVAVLSAFVSEATRSAVVDAGGDPSSTSRACGRSGRHRRRADGPRNGIASDNRRVRERT